MNSCLRLLFALVDLTATRPRVAFERTIGRRAELAQASAAALVHGYGQALSEILAELDAGRRAAAAR